MARSIMGMIGLAATLVFALPAAMLGLELLLVGGRPYAGAGLIVIAALMILVEEHLTTPGDIPGMVANQTVGRLVKEPDEDE